MTGSRLVDMVMLGGGLLRPSVGLPDVALQYRFDECREDVGMWRTIRAIYFNEDTGFSICRKLTISDALALSVRRPGGGFDHDQARKVCELVADFVNSLPNPATLSDKRLGRGRPKWRLRKAKRRLT